LRNAECGIRTTAEGLRSGRKNGEAEKPGKDQKEEVGPVGPVGRFGRAVKPGLPYPPRFIGARGYCRFRSLIPGRCPGLLSSALSGHLNPAGSEARPFLKRETGDVTA